MDLLISLLCIWICLQKVIFAVLQPNDVDDQQWNSFKTEFNKKYATAEEDAKRRIIYSENLKKISSHNTLFELHQKSYKMGANEFADLTQEEFASMYLSKPRPYQVKQVGSKHQGCSKDAVNKQPPPNSINWVQLRAMTGVKEQGACGCSWALATISAIEAHQFIKTGVKHTLSGQNLLDCVGSQTGSGAENSCVGGYPGDALQYVIDHGVETAESYPYEAKQGACRYDPNKKAASITDYQMLQTRDEIAMRDFVGLTGPIICSYVADDDFRFYKSGIYTGGTCGTEANHALVVVGYGTEGANVNYWLVKNSWGPKWGEAGYIKIARGGNVCQIATETFCPII